MGWNRTTRDAADYEFGRRNYMLVKFWGVWVALAVAGAAGLGYVLLTSPATPTPHHQTPTQVSRETGSGSTLPYLVGGLIAVGAVALIVVGVRRRRDEQLIAQIELDAEQADVEDAQETLPLRVVPDHYDDGDAA
jgi:hypothetical protein